MARTYEDKRQGSMDINARLRDNSHTPPVLSENHKDRQAWSCSPRHWKCRPDQGNTVTISGYRQQMGYRTYPIVKPWRSRLLWAAEQDKPVILTSCMLFPELPESALQDVFIEYCRACTNRADQSLHGQSRPRTNGKMHESPKNAMGMVALCKTDWRIPDGRK